MSCQSLDLLNAAQIEPAEPWIEFAQRVLVHARQVRASLAAEAHRHGLSEPEIEMLWACAKAPPSGHSQKVLASDLAISPAHVSCVVERLRHAGLLECSMVKGDRRLRLWQLTPAGQAIWQMLLNDSTQQEKAA